MKDVILTGLRANDQLTLGNYLGGILPMIQLQRNQAGAYQLNMFVPDLHSFTTPIDHQSLYETTLQNLRIYTAAGLDLNDDDTYLYRQSFIPAHSELTWILDCFTSMGEASRMTQFKDKSKDSGDHVSVGLFNYPILMAADILLYGAKWVPVGEDQHQHLELCRDIAQRMNRKFGDLFIVPATTAEQNKFINLDKGLRVRDLLDPTKKMSKSNPSPSSKILMTDKPDLAYKKIMSATTDSLAKINFDWQNQPGITNLLQILAILTKQTQAKVNQEWLGQTNYGDFKKVVAQVLADFLKQFQSDLQNLDEQLLLSKLETSEQVMRQQAALTLDKVQRAVGLRR